MFTEHDRGDGAIPVVGIAGRFPGTNTVQAFGDDLCAGVESIATMDGVGWFDAAFSRYTSHEALFLEYAWQTIEHVGHDPERYLRTMGVLGGSTTNPYLRSKLKGPNSMVQTARSRSCVAVHSACQRLLNQEGDLALADGVAVQVKHPAGYWYPDGGNRSPEGHCRPSDARDIGTAAKLRRTTAREAPRVVPPSQPGGRR